MTTTIAVGGVLYALLMTPLFMILLADRRDHEDTVKSLRKKLRVAEVALADERRKHADCRKHHTFDLPAPRAAEPVWRDKGGQVIPMQRGTR